MSFSRLGRVPKFLALAAVACALIFAATTRAAAQLIDFDAAPLSYSSRPTSDPASRLSKRLDSGETRLVFDPEKGYLPALLKALRIDASSQALVFSKTSFQRELISPSSPRALYYDDDTYVGYVRHGEVLEVASVDPEQGAIFYTLAQDPSKAPALVRRNSECLQCHASPMTKGVPGLLVRSVYSDASGQPVFRAGTFLTDHSSPFKERWGGWYVTGTHGAERHLGNSFLTDASGDPAKFDSSAGANLTDLKSRFSADGYLSGHSDIVSLMVLEHQTQLHNLIIAASYQARLALQDEAALREMLKEPDGPPTQSTLRRFDYSSRPLLRYLLFVDEAPLSSPIRGTSSFTEEFQARGPRDRKGRSLRELDLTRRLFRYPLSFLIYSESFARFPGAFREHFFQRLREILTGGDTSKDFSGLAAEDRGAVLEILADTRKDLPESWRTMSLDGAGSSTPRARL